MSDETDPLARAEKLEARERVRIVIDIDADDAEFIARFAAYRNAVNALEGRRVTPWSRKTSIEAFVSAQLASIRTNLKEVFAKLGELPDAKNKAAMRAYAARVDALVSKSDKKR